jgi:hypothetical protein
MKNLDDQVRQLDGSRGQPTEDRKNKDAAYRLAQKDLDQLEAELRQIGFAALISATRGGKTK